MKWNVKLYGVYMNWVCMCMLREFLGGSADLKRFLHSSYVSRWLLKAADVKLESYSSAC